MSNTIPPRTKGERKAYVSGYADALVEVLANGMSAAQEWLIQMVEHDDPEIAAKMRERLAS